MKKIYLLENTSQDEDADNRIIWSPDDDCEQIHEGYKIIGTYLEQTKLTEAEKLLERLAADLEYVRGGMAIVCEKSYESIKQFNDYKGKV